METDKDIDINYFRKRYEYSLDVFNKEKDRKTSLENKAQFYLSFISLIIASIFLNFDFISMISKTNLVGKSIVDSLFIIIVLLLFLTIFITLVFVFFAIKTRNYKNEHPSNILEDVMNIDSNFILEETEEEFLFSTTIGYLVATSVNKKINNTKALYIRFTSYGLIGSVVLIAIATIMTAYLI